ncbi:MAG: hypothetical protein KC684_03785 [Candidatus Omnitrophica bacterium]|nr:hypothetical protein [Candidatus Omnitrophota bacterium]
MTLIEVLVVVSLISLISIAVYTSLSSALRVWKRSRQAIVEQEIVFFFEKITQDLRNSFLYSGISYEGGENELSFPTIIQTLPDSDSSLSSGEDIDQIGQVSYEYDLNEKALLRRQANYSQAIREKKVPATVVLKNVERVRFRYIYFTDDGEFTNPAVMDTPPSAVEIEVAFGDKKGNRVMRKFIDVPVGN